MSGLDNIISRLDKECFSECEAIIKEAEEKAAAILSEAQNKTENEAAEKKTAAEKAAELTVEKAHSSAASLERKLILSAKVELIDGILEKALLKLRALDEPSYFGVLKKLAVKNTREGKGIMYLYAGDIKRLPEDFSAQLGNIEISETPLSSADDSLCDGFILKYGDIEINCTFPAMLAASKDELKAIAGEMLFGK